MAVFNIPLTELGMSDCARLYGQTTTDGRATQIVTAPRRGCLNAKDEMD